jgi:hypothetical protein
MIPAQARALRSTILIRQENVTRYRVLQSACRALCSTIEPADVLLDHWLRLPLHDASAQNCSEDRRTVTEESAPVHDVAVEHPRHESKLAKLCLGNRRLRHEDMQMRVWDWHQKLKTHIEVVIQDS